MLIAEMPCDGERVIGVAHAAEEEDPLAAYFDAARGAFSPNTERALRADVEIFAAWCRHHLRVAVPASAATVVAFIDDRARVKAPATVRRYVSSIATLHKALRHTNPLEHARIRFALQRMHRRRGRRQAQVQGLTWPLRNRLLEAAGDRLIDIRNRALLALGYDTLLRRSELVSLELPDLLEEIDGTATLLVRSGKTDAEGRGATLYLARDTVQLVKTWLERGGRRARARPGRRRRGPKRRLEVDPEFHPRGRTTNNRMEIMAVIKGLEALKENCAVRLFGDSEYVVNSITKGWARRWKARNWRRKQQVVPNLDLWHRLLKLADLQDLRAEWVKGHVGHPENERCDEIARLAASTHFLPPDAGFENPAAPP